MIEDLALDKRIVRQSCDPIACGEIDKVLRLFLNDFAVVVQDKEPDGNLFGKARIQRQVLIDRGRRRILRALTALFSEPAAEGKARLDRVGGQRDRRSRRSRQFAVDSVVDHERNGKDVLFIVSIDREVFGNDRTDGELVGRARIYPLADLVRLRRDFRQIVDRKAIVDVGHSGFFRAVFLHEGDRIDDLLLADNRSERSRHDGVRRDFRFGAGHNPLGVIAGYRRNSRKLITDLLADGNLDRRRSKLLVRIRCRIERNRHGR